MWNFCGSITMMIRGRETRTAPALTVDQLMPVAERKLEM
jgi:hypothetical protein